MDVVKTVAAILFIFVVLPVTILKLGSLVSGALRRRYAARHPERIPGTPEYMNRLRSPQFADLELSLNLPLPDAYRHLYENFDLVLAKDFYLVPEHTQEKSDGYEILHFLPAQPSVSEEVWKEPNHFLPFALDGVGDIYYLDLRETGGNSAVYILHHDAGDRETISPNLKEFLSWRRIPRSEFRS